MANLIQRRRRIDASFDLTPLIDVVFQLLIFLMISSQFKKPEAVIELPQVPGKATVREDRPDTLKVGISADGSLQLEGATIERSDFATTVANLVGQGAERVEIRGDQDASYGVFVEIMEESREAGIKSIGIVKEVPRESGGSGSE